MGFFSFGGEDNKDEPFREGDVTKGAKVFKQRCSQCHNVDAKVCQTSA